MGTVADQMAEAKSKPPQDVVAEIGVDDLYAFLGVESTSSEKQVCLPLHTPITSVMATPLYR